MRRGTTACRCRGEIWARKHRRPRSPPVFPPWRNQAVPSPVTPVTANFYPAGHSEHGSILLFCFHEYRNLKGYASV